MIPVLVDDATMPRADVLPNELKDLPRRQAIRIAHDRFRDDAERLARWLERVLAEVEAQREAERRQAEEEARRQAEEAKRRQAEGKARRQAEEAKRRQAEEKARPALEPIRARRRDLRWPRLGSFVRALQPRAPRREWLIALAPLVALTAASVWFFEASDKEMEAPEFTPPPPMETTAKPLPDLPPPDATALWSQIDTVSCAVLTWDLNGSVVVLKGHAGAADSINALARNLRAIPGITDVVVNAVAPLDDVHCRPIDLVKPYAVANRERELGLSFTPAMATFTAGEGLPLKVGGTSRDGYLYVDYYRADGSVLHMLPGPGVSYHRLLAQKQIDLGEGGGSRQEAISPPYGVGLFVAVTTREPMVRAPRDPEVEQTDAYLRALKQLLECTAIRGGMDSIAASLAVIMIQSPGGL